MILSLIPWAKFNIHVFEKINEVLVGIPFIGQVFGQSLPLGEWYFPEITMLFLMMAVLVGITYRMKEEKFVQVFMAGAADLLGVALICALARGIQVIMNDGMITATILNFGEHALSGLSAQVFRSKYARQFDQAENRMHSIKAIMALTAGNLFVNKV